MKILVSYEFEIRRRVWLNACTSCWESEITVTLLIQLESQLEQGKRVCVITLSERKVGMLFMQTIIRDGLDNVDVTQSQYNLIKLKARG